MMAPGTTAALLREVARLYVGLQREQAAACSGTTLTQCTIITELGRSGACTLAGLARRLGLDKSWLSRAVDTLAASGTVYKASHPSDRRSIIIGLTAAGQERYHVLHTMLDLQAQRIMEAIPEMCRAEVAHTLELLQDALHAEIQAIQYLKGEQTCGEAE